MFDSKKAKPKAQASRTDNLLESLRDIGGGTAKSFKKDLAQGVPSEFLRQLFGMEKPKLSASGEIAPGQSLEIDAVLAAEQKENKTLRLQLLQEKRLLSEERVLFEKKSQELKLELQAVVSEVGQLAQTTQTLSQEVKIATMEAPANPGIYHLIFFEKLREFIRSFRQKIESAATWLEFYNKRAAKRRTFWGQVGVAGAKRLLSPEDYAQRSAG